MKREQFVNLIILQSSISLVTDQHETLVLRGATNHTKYGTPGVEDGTDHEFLSWVILDGRLGKASVRARSDDDGESYTLSARIEILPNDNISE